MDDQLSNLGHASSLPHSMLVGFLDSVPASAAILDTNGSILAVNAAWRRFAAENGAPRDAWVGADYLSFADDAEIDGDSDAAIVADGVREVLAGRLEWFGHEYPCHSPQRQRWYRCLVTQLPDSEGIAGAAVMHLDITLQKQAEFTAQTANKAKSEFLANLSHELRTPLNAILGFSEMMVIEAWGGLGDPHYRSYAEDIHNAGSHLLSLINEVLDLSKVEAGRFELHEEELNLHGLTEHCLALITPRAEQAGIGLARDLGSPPRLRADSRIFIQILLNLLSNAVKFTPVGGTVSVAIREAKDGWLEISVRDTGIGIAAADMERVMEPFGQVDSDMSRRHSREGTGLGLPLTSRFLHLHGGRLVLDSIPGQGTTVTARFPPERIVG